MYAQYASPSDGGGISAAAITASNNDYAMPTADAANATPTAVYAQYTAAPAPHGTPNAGPATARSPPTLSVATRRPVLSAGRGARKASGGLSAALTAGRSAASVKRVRSRAATLSRATTVEGVCTVIFPGKKAGAKAWLVGSASTDGASSKLEIYDSKAAGVKGMPKLTIRGKNILSAKKAVLKGKDAVVITEKGKETTLLASGPDGARLLAGLLAFTSKQNGIVGEGGGAGEVLLNTESRL